jgi:hypothetical protein
METIRRVGAEDQLPFTPRKFSRDLRADVAPAPHRIVGIGLVLSFGLLEWSVEMKSPQFTSTFMHDIYLSSRALVTLNDGDPKNAASQFLSVCEGGLGFAFLGLVVGYLPVLYQSFAKRELVISLLDARAGSQPSAGGLLAATPFEVEGIIQQLERWEFVDGATS